MLRRSVKDWRPDPAQGALDVLEKFTVNTSAWAKWPSHLVPENLLGIVDRAEHMLTCIAEPKPEGTLLAYHVSDDPDEVMARLRAKDDLTRIFTNQYPYKGLRVSLVPNYWKRYSSAARYGFLTTLSADARDMLVKLVLDRLDEQARAGYITTGEWGRARHNVLEWQSEKLKWSIEIVNDQPYNIDLPELARKYGIAIPQEPAFVEVLFRGRFVDMGATESLDAAEDLADIVLEGGSKTRDLMCKILGKYGWQGVFTRSSMGHEAQLIIQNAFSVIEYGGEEV